MVKENDYWNTVPKYIRTNKEKRFNYILGLIGGDPNIDETRLNELINQLRSDMTSINDRLDSMESTGQDSLLVDLLNDAILADLNE